MPRSETRALQPLVDALLQRHGGVNAVLYYGSCLRSGNPFAGIVDCYLIVDSYRACYERRWLALTNWLLPPNVFYTEVPADGGLLRCKYTVISAKDFSRGASRWFESYIWGRFAQPAAILYSRDPDCRERLAKQLRQCAITFLNRVLPRLPAEGSVRGLWQEGLQLSYASELRAESTARSAELVDSDYPFYEQTLLDCLDELRFPVKHLPQNGATGYRARVPAPYRLASRLSWALRRIQGKLLSLLRVVKALFTFEGGLDYLVWKLERHSGQRIEIPERVRRHPLIFIWGFALGLYRRGIFR